MAFEEPAGTTLGLNELGSDWRQGGAFIWHRRCSLVMGAPEGGALCGAETAWRGAARDLCSDPGRRMTLGNIKPKVESEKEVEKNKPPAQPPPPVQGGADRGKDCGIVSG